jgi:hypothetical protein
MSHENVEVPLKPVTAPRLNGRRSPVDVAIADAPGSPPLHPDRVRKVLSEDPPRIGTNTDSARYVEAWMVQSGATPERTKAASSALSPQS